MVNGPKILFLDIETSPLLSYTWGIFDQTIGLNQIKKDWGVLSWSAKWGGKKEILYEALGKKETLQGEKKILKKIWRLLDECDIAVGHNLDRFDIKKLNTRFLKHGLGKPSSFQTIDTLKLAKKRFSLTSNKLEYLAKFLGVRQLKSAHKAFPGFELWDACMEGNKRAWEEMRSYNRQDVSVLELVYEKLLPWGVGVNFDVFYDDLKNHCACGSSTFKKNGPQFKKGFGVYQRYACTECGDERRGQENLLSSAKRKSMLR